MRLPAARPRQAHAGPHPLAPSPEAGRGGEGGAEDLADRGSAATSSAHGIMMIFVGAAPSRRPSPPAPSPKAGRGGEGRPEDLANRGSVATSSAYGIMMIFRRCGSQPHVLDRPMRLGKKRGSAATSSAYASGIGLWLSATRSCIAPTDHKTVQRQGNRRRSWLQRERSIRKNYASSS